MKRARASGAADGPDLGGDPILDRRSFAQIAAEYRRRWRLDVLAVDRTGTVLAGAGHQRADNREPARHVRLFAIDEALRWGEPTLAPLEGGDKVCWAVPLMTNSRSTGGLLVYCPAGRLALRAAPSPHSVDARLACTHLRELAEQANLTNAALLYARRIEYQREQQRAEAIHDFKAAGYFNLRGLYLVDEPALIAAIRRGDRGMARDILNRLLVAILHHAGRRLDLVKSFFMELVATMSRTAVESGGAPEELLGANFTSIAQLAHLRCHEELAPWLHQMLEHVMDSIQRHRGRTPTVLLAGALDFIARNCTGPITRDQAARAAHLSPSYFSRLFKKQLGQSFSHVLNQKRVERAADLLARSDQDLKLIALESGFSDQSYFTKVFRRHTGQTPRAYRHRHRSAAT